jgi:hypothetical protein
MDGTSESDPGAGGPPWHFTHINRLFATRDGKFTSLVEEIGASFVDPEGSLPDMEARRRIYHVLYERRLGTSAEEQFSWVDCVATELVVRLGHITNVSSNFIHNIAKAEIEKALKRSFLVDESIRSRYDHMRDQAAPLHGFLFRYLEQRMKETLIGRDNPIGTPDETLVKVLDQKSWREWLEAVANDDNEAEAQRTDIKLKQDTIAIFNLESHIIEALHNRMPNSGLLDSTLLQSCPKITDALRRLIARDHFLYPGLTPELLRRAEEEDPPLTPKERLDFFFSKPVFGRFAEAAGQQNGNQAQKTALKICRLGCTAYPDIHHALRMCQQLRAELCDPLDNKIPEIGPAVQTKIRAIHNKVRQRFKIYRQPLLIVPPEALDSIVQRARG